MATTRTEDESESPAGDGVLDDGESESDERPAPSTAYVALVRFSFPTAALILALVYVESTYGRIRTENLYYPYFVIGMLLLLVGATYVSELRDLYAHSPSQTFLESVESAVREWWRTISFAGASVVYLWLIEPLGFFVATFFGIIAIMLIGGLRDVKLIAAGTLVVLALIYVLFIELMGLQPPGGSPLGL